MALPSGYTELEYIESTGEQYLDAGFIPNQDTRVYAEAVLPISSGSTQALFGCRVSSSSRQFQFVTQGGYYRSDYNTTISNFTTHDYGTEKFYIDKNKQNTDLNGEYSTSHTYGEFTCPGNMFIFATNNNGSLYALSTARLCVLKRWDNGTLANHFIPCRTDTDEIGMWDDVNGVFHGNMGSGTFVAGPEVVPENPMEPYDGHNTNIGQVAREIEGGTPLIGGVAREIESGLVLVGGAAREIEFGDDVCTVNITGAGSTAYAWVSLNGTIYTSEVTVEVPPGTKIAFTARSNASYEAEIILNGETIKSATYDYVAYEMTVEQDMSVYLFAFSAKKYGTITITTG